MSAYTASSLKAELNARGWRLTPQREKILHVFQNLPKGNHLSAEELQELLDKRGEGISLSTIYRSVKLMSRMGILRELELAEGHKHYELNQPYPHHHHHLVCIQCNKTIEFNSWWILVSKTARFPNQRNRNQKTRYLSGHSQLKTESFFLH